jgi:hypothetical protein
MIILPIRDPFLFPLLFRSFRSFSILSTIHLFLSSLSARALSGTYSQTLSKRVNAEEIFRYIPKSNTSNKETQLKFKNEKYAVGKVMRIGIEKNY